MLSYVNTLYVVIHKQNVICTLSGTIRWLATHTGFLSGGIHLEPSTW